MLSKYLVMIFQGYVDFGRFDKFNYFVAGSGHINFVQVSLIWSYILFVNLLCIHRKVGDFFQAVQFFFLCSTCSPIFLSLYSYLTDIFFMNLLH